MKICFITAEAAPLAKAGGLADVSGALLKYLHADGHDIRLFLPAYAAVKRRLRASGRFDAEPVAILQNVPCQLGSYTYTFSVFTCQLPGSQAPVYLVDCPECFNQEAIYGAGADEHRRFLLLTHAALMSCQRMAFAPDIVHCNDWHTAVAPMLLRSTYAWDRLFQNTRSILTLHNVGYQGVFGLDALPEILAGADATMLDAAELARGRVNLLRTGVLHADVVTTVSPTYAQEIQRPEFGMGLEDLLRARGNALVGILNGVDYDSWDPRHDNYLPLHYDADHLGGKTAIKARLLEKLGLAAVPGPANLAGGHGPVPRVPLLGIISRLASQKGFDLLMEALPPLLLSRRFSLVVLGSGEARYEQFFADTQRRFPSRVHFHRGYSDELAHWVEAGSDIFLMPSQYEPCGLNQMYSLRYGTVPIVRRTGGLADSVQHFDPASGTGTGVVFNDYDVPAVRWAVGTALEWFEDERNWRRLMQNGMAQDFSWRRQVKRYEDLYVTTAGKQP